MPNAPSKPTPPPPGHPANGLETVGCDLCGSDEASTIYESNIERVETAAEESFSSSRQRATHGRVVKCESCELVRTNPRDPPATLSTVYSRLEDPLYDAESANRTVTARRELDFVERFAVPPGRLLDVGCSTGIFLSVARERGWDVEGIEASTWAAKKAGERFGLNEIRVAFVEEADFPAASFDAVTMWDVLEHVHSPTLVLDRLHGWLKPYGLLFINVPNIESTMSKLLRHRWPLLLREHLWYFSPRTLDIALTKAGLRILGTRSNRVTFSLANVFLRLEQYGGHAAPLWRRLARARALRKLKLSFPIGELTVVARRDLQR